MVELRTCIEEFQLRRQPGEGRRTEDSDNEDCAALSVPDKLDEEDFQNLGNYVKAVKPFTVLSKFLGGEKYPTASSVIPALEQIKEDLRALQSEVEVNVGTVENEVLSQFLANILTNQEKRFKDGFKRKTPLNCLTFLDPRYVDLYAMEPELFEAIVEDIAR